MKAHTDTRCAESDKLHTFFTDWAKDKLNIARKSAVVDDRPLPRREIFDRAERLLYALLENGIKPMFVNPSFDGGIIIEFKNEGVYYMTEIDNEDDVVFLIRDKDGVKAFDLTPENYLDQILDRI